MTNSKYVNVTRKGQLTLPREIRKKLGITTPGRAEVSFDEKSGSAKVGSVPDIMELAGNFKVKDPVDPVKIREQMEKNYKRV